MRSRRVPSYVLLTIALAVLALPAAAGSLKSLHQFLWRAGLSTGIRLHAGRFADERLTVRMPEGELAYRLLSLPLYLAEKLPDLKLEPSSQE